VEIGGPQLAWCNSNHFPMFVNTMQGTRRTTIAANLLVLLLFADSALSWTGTAPVNSTPPSSSRYPSLLSPYKKYSLKLSPFVPALAQARGVLVDAHINGGPTLSLLLDSGTRDLVLKDKVARKSGVQPSSSVELVRIGKASMRQVPFGIVKKLDIDQLSMANVPVEIVDSDLGEGVDGVVPTAIFSNFLIHIDVPEKAVDLTPYPEKVGQDPFGDIVPARLHNGILFLAATVDSKPGFMMLDTGSAYNGIARLGADDSRLPVPFAPRVEVETLNGLVHGQFGAVAELRAGDPRAAIDRPIIVNLDAMSRYHGIEIVGMLGFPAFEHSSVTIDYRDCLVIFSPEKHRLRRNREHVTRR
jgi:hypothetical protein